MGKEEIRNAWEEVHNREEGWETRPIASIAYRHLRENIGERDTVLELAFGLAENLRELKRRAKDGRVIGVDFSKKAVSEAREELKGEEGIDVSLGDIHELPLKDEVANKIILTDFFGMYPKKDCIHLIKEAYRVLKPGGDLMFTAYTKRVDKQDGVSSSHPFTRLELRHFIDKHLGSPQNVEIKMIPESEKEWRDEINKRSKKEIEEIMGKINFKEITREHIVNVLARMEREFSGQVMHLVHLRKPKE